MTCSSITIQITPEARPSLPSWMGEVAAFARVLTHVGSLKAIQDHVRFARARIGTYELIDFVAVLIGYILSGEPTLLAFYERLVPFAEPFMAPFGRNRLPHRSTLSRFLAALDQTTVEALRTLFQKDLLARQPFPSPGGLLDPWVGREGNCLIVHIPERSDEKESKGKRDRKMIVPLSKVEEVVVLGAITLSTPAFNC